MSNKSHDLASRPVRVGSGRVVHMSAPNGKRAMCGAGDCSIGTRRRSPITPVDGPVTCKKCLARMEEDDAKETPPTIGPAVPAAKEDDAPQGLPSTGEYSQFDRAYQHFNRVLFDNRLAPVFFTYNRKRNAYGYFHAGQFRTRDGQEIHEISMNPGTFADRDPLEILSTLVHEMTHLEQQQYGKPSRNGYHNKQWAGMMEQVGLVPFNVKDPSKRTGQACSHSIAPDGPFAYAAAALLQDGWELKYSAYAGEGKGQSAKRKVKYTCPVTGEKAWGKPGMTLFTDQGAYAGKPMEPDM